MDLSDSVSSPSRGQPESVQPKVPGASKQVFTVHLSVGVSIMHTDALRWEGVMEVLKNLKSSHLQKKYIKK